MAKTFIAVPCMDQVPAQFAHNLATLSKVGECVVGFQIGSLVYNSRNELAKKAIACGSDFTLWLDSDMVFEPDLLQRLMIHMVDPEISMVSGVYYRRVMPYSPVLYDKLDIQEGKCTYTETSFSMPETPFEIEACGFGAVLMRTNVLMSVAGKYGDMFAPLYGNGEDVSFCWRARQCGYKIICDPSIQLGHVGHMVVNRDFALSYSLSQLERQKAFAEEYKALEAEEHR